MNLQSSKEKNAARELANKALEDTWLAEARDREPAPEGFVSWVLTSKGHIPPGAFVAGRDIDGSLMYVARAMHQGSLIPGRTSPAFHDGCRIPWNGKEIFKQTYEILIAPAQYLQWVECSSGKWVVPAGIEPLDVGYEADGMPLYAGQVAHEYNSLQLGKCGGHLSGCLIAFSKERCFRNFKFLAYRYW
ncbi:hypothetical protein DFS34DRAFT_17557 [Phlyctochytrium arcticum]|nr:hypothetical protein DFS34DRAFT_17557 [Phlyctochytrium arcticum]